MTTINISPAATIEPEAYHVGARAFHAGSRCIVEDGRYAFGSPDASEWHRGYADERIKAYEVNKAA